MSKRQCIFLPLTAWPMLLKFSDVIEHFASGAILPAMVPVHINESDASVMVEQPSNKDHSGVPIVGGEPGDTLKQERGGEGSSKRKRGRPRKYPAMKHCKLADKGGTDCQPPMDVLTDNTFDQASKPSQVVDEAIAPQP